MKDPATRTTIRTTTQTNEKEKESQEISLLMRVLLILRKVNSNVFLAFLLILTVVVFFFGLIGLLFYLLFPNGLYLAGAFIPYFFYVEYNKQKIRKIIFQKKGGKQC